MNSVPQRVSLSRIIAVNWRGFRQFIDLEGNTVVAGAFGTGRLLQVSRFAQLVGALVIKKIVNIKV